MNIYLCEPGAKARIRENHLVVTCDDEVLAQYPIEKIESVTLFTTCQITSQCIEELSRHDVDITWITRTGKIIGSLLLLNNNDVIKQKQQFAAIDNTEFCLGLSRKIIYAKLHNQRTFLLRRGGDDETEKTAAQLKIFRDKAENAQSLDELKGFEGIGARLYFDGIKKFIPDIYNFRARIKNPPSDLVNSVLSFCYTLLFNDILTTLQNCGLNPYVGILHSLKKGHPALASDMIEEFRSIVSDAVALDFLNNYGPDPSDCRFTPEGACYIDGKHRSKLISLYETKVHSTCGYLSREGFQNDYRGAFKVHAYEYIEAITSGDYKLYDCVLAR